MWFLAAVWIGLGGRGDIIILAGPEFSVEEEIREAAVISAGRHKINKRNITLAGWQYRRAMGLDGTRWEWVAQALPERPPWSVRGRGRKGKERKASKSYEIWPPYGVWFQRWGVDARSGEIVASGNWEGGTNGFLETRGNQESSYLFFPYFSSSLPPSIKLYLIPRNLPKHFPVCNLNQNSSLHPYQLLETNLR